MQRSGCRHRPDARRHGDRLAIDSPLTRNDLNDWDGVHYRVPVATRIAEELAAATLGNSSGLDGSYVVLVR